MALLYIGVCKECNEEKALYDTDKVGMGGWQDISENGICGDCCGKLKNKKRNEEPTATEVFAQGH